MKRISKGTCFSNNKSNGIEIYQELRDEKKNDKEKEEEEEEEEEEGREF